MASNDDTSLGKHIKGVFCLEGEWTGDLRHPSSLEPILELLRNRDRRFSYIHRFVITRDEFTAYLKKWTLKKYSGYSILYLACHGAEGQLYFNSSRRDPGISLDELEQSLAGKCRRRIICLGSCSALDIEGRRIEQFLETTCAVAVCGYRFDVDWIKSTAFELLLLACLQVNAPNVRGMRAARKTIRQDAGTLAKSLGFHMVIRKPKSRIARQ